MAEFALRINLFVNQPFKVLLLAVLYQGLLVYYFLSKNGHDVQRMERFYFV